MSRIGHEVAHSPSGADRKIVLKHLFQLLGVSIEKGNAALIPSRSIDTHDFEFRCVRLMALCDPLVS